MMMMIVKACVPVIFSLALKPADQLICAYYVNNGSSVYCTFLDVSKAFDRIA